jgi:hypothetical protein
MKFLIVTASLVTLNAAAAADLPQPPPAGTRRRQSSDRQNSSWQGSDRKVPGRKVARADRHQGLTRKGYYGCAPTGVRYFCALG